MVFVIDRTSDARSNTLRTRQEAFGTWIRMRSPQVMLAAVALSLVGRVVAAQTGRAFGWADLAVVALTIALIGPVEWVLHRTLLHAPDESFRMRRLGTGSGHRRHHLDPHDVGWILLSGADAAAFAMLIAAWTAAWAIPVALIFGGSLLGPFLTALVAAYVALAHYEWVHLLVHTAYRPTSRLYRRLAVNHRLHHYRNEHYWLGVTSNLGDRALRTLPADKSDVPLSATARSLSG